MYFSTILLSAAALSTVVFASPIANPNPVPNASPVIHLTPREPKKASKTVPMKQRDSDPAYTATPLNFCLSNEQAFGIVNAFIYLLENPTADNFVSTANALLADSFIDTSDSINWLAGIPLGSVTFNSRDAFIAGSGSQPPLYVNTLEVFYGCANIGWRWVTTGGVGTNQYPVKGIDEFTVSPEGQILSVYAEFNSAAFAADLS